LVVIETLSSSGLASMLADGAKTTGYFSLKRSESAP
jgi:hypothetical protein